MRHVRTLLALALTAGILAGCGGEDGGSDTTSAASPNPVVTGEDNGLADKRARLIYKQSREAAVSADSYSVTGTIPGGEGALDLAFDFTRTSSKGTITAPDKEPIELLITPEFTYVKGEDALDPSVAGPDAAKKLEGKWLQIPSSDPSAQGFAAFANGPTFASGLLSPKSELTKGDVGEAEGVPAVELVSTGSLWVSLVGEPYPISVEGAEQGATVTFANWNGVGEITPPAEGEYISFSDLVFG
jgi:hypothetical protein